MIAELVHRLIAQGVDPGEAAAIVAEAALAGAGMTRSKGAARTQRWRHKASQSVTVTESDTPPSSPSPSSSPTPPITTPSPSTTPETISVGRGATRPMIADPFEEFWKAYPKRDGSNPKHPAKTKFVAAVKSGTEPAAIIAGAGRYAAEASAKGQVGTPYVMQASTWLTKRCWADYAPIINGATGPPAPPPREFPKISQDLIEKFAVWWTPAIPESVPPEQWQSFQQELKNGKANSGQAASVVRSGDGIREGQAGFL